MGRLIDEKALFFLHELFPLQLGTQLPIRALVMPRLELDALTTLGPASPSEAVRAIAASTIVQLPYAGDEVIRAIAATARRVPAFHLQIGSDAAVRLPLILSELAGGKPGAGGG